jgi:hypothetical protein
MFQRVGKSWRRSGSSNSPSYDFSDRIAKPDNPLLTSCLAHRFLPRAKRKSRAFGDPLH